MAMPIELLTEHANAAEHIGPLLDRERAAQILSRLGLTGLVVTNPTNVYYLTGYDGTAYNSSLPSNFPCFAVLPQDPAQPVGLIIASFQYYFSFSDIHATDAVAIYQHTTVPAASDGDVSNNNAQMSTGAARMAPGATWVWPDRQLAAMDEIETSRMAHVQREAGMRVVGTSAMDSLGRAANELGLNRGRIGVDFLGLPQAAALQASIPHASLEDATTTMARLRLVKSPAEIELMRVAVRNNAEAALAACLTVRAGATFRDLRAAFNAEAARRGNNGVWLLVDRTSVECYRGAFRDGQSFMIDAVSSFAGYHGDYGRTVCIGEPIDPIKRYTKAIGHAWDAVRETLRPGVSFQAIQRTAQDALDKGGFDTGVRFTPHSVGLFHTDARALGDIVLEPGMIISVDCPVVDAGIGGSAHLEDMTLITRDGSETLNSIDNRVILI